MLRCHRRFSRLPVTAEETIERRTTSTWSPDPTHPRTDMTTPRSRPHDVISRDSVRVVAQPAMLGCGDGDDSATSGTPMAVVPLLDGDRVAGFEVRCGCGAAAVVECVYEDTPTEEPR